MPPTCFTVPTLGLLNQYLNTVIHLLFVTTTYPNNTQCASRRIHTRRSYVFHLCLYIMDISCSGYHSPLQVRFISMYNLDQHIGHLPMVYPLKFMFLYIIFGKKLLFSPLPFSLSSRPFIARRCNCKYICDEHFLWYICTFFCYIYLIRAFCDIQLTWSRRNA